MGAIAFGKRLFGRVDNVRGRFYVATLCLHFCYLPLLPLGSYIIFDCEMQGMSTRFNGLRIRFSVKSWLIGWIRVILIPVVSLTAFTSVALWFIDSPKNRVDWTNYPAMLMTLAVMALLLLATYITPGIGRATASRTASLDAKAHQAEPPADMECSAHALS